MSARVRKHAIFSSLSGSMRNGKNDIEIMVFIIKLKLIHPMDAFKNPSTPPAAKALSLVRLHHGAPSSEMPSIPSFDGITRNASRTAWKQGARMNHLHAKRRQRVLENIDEAAMPVILEIDGGKNFVVLKERIDDEVIVQFPDGREAPVSLERLNERYSGFCIFLSPVNESARGGFFRQILGSLKKSWIDLPTSFAGSPRSRPLASVAWRRYRSGN